MTQQLAKHAPSNHFPLIIMIASLAVLITVTVIVISNAPWAQAIKSDIVTYVLPAFHTAMRKAHVIEIVQKVIELLRKHVPP
jgi:hypothetical protein